MTTPYFFAKDGKRQGPVDLEDLKLLALKGELTRQHRVWSKGMKMWQKADSVAGLFDELPPDLEPAPHPVIAEPEPNGSHAQISPAPRPPFNLIKNANKCLDKLIVLLAPPEEAEATPSYESADAVATDTADRHASAADAQQDQSGVVPAPAIAGSVGVKKCSYCGRENSATRVCCRECGGTDFKSTAPQERDLGISSAARPCTKRVYRLPKGVRFGVAIAACCVIAVTGWISLTSILSFRRQNTESQSQASSQPLSPEAVRNIQAREARQSRFESDVDLARTQLEAEGFNSEAASHMAPLFVEQARRHHVALELQHGMRPSDEELDDLYFAQSKITDRLP